MYIYTYIYIYIHIYIYIYVMSGLVCRAPCVSGIIGFLAVKATWGLDELRGFRVQYN